MSLVAAALMCAAVVGEITPGLPPLGVNSTLTVSGLSAGAYQAVQFHVANSKAVKGVGVFAGGPYWCAQDNVEVALHACMVEPKNINPSELGYFTEQAAHVASIDPTSNIASSLVYIYSGTNDSVVVPGVAPKLVDYYKRYVSEDRILLVNNVTSEHTMPTANGFGNPCGFLGTPYISQCGYDGAYAALEHLLGPDLVRALPSAAKQANLKPFDQTGFFLDGEPRLVGMDVSGFIYIPDRCQEADSRCRLHIVFHGCEQGAYLLHDTFAWNAGYNPHAEANNIVVLYPQAYRVDALNPKGCYDWWGYTGADYATKLGPQIGAVWRMVGALQRTRDDGRSSGATVDQD